ncbi:hypothetical protein NP493_1610g01017 [Ridgeia piscesae]|uniref:lysozyme n=1 Tax=Ridgeia piscesae TaxID=27915 RepID=A0AAD9NAC6_RIDPI|nr:hypothetical protein NP493_1610g01017 [Ridgeia piscesae]
MFQVPHQLSLLENGEKDVWKIYYKCLKNKKCKEKTVIKYLSYYNSGGDFVSCFHYARIHNKGPWGWKLRSAVRYRNKVENCCNSIPGGCYTYN